MQKALAAADHGVGTISHGGHWRHKKAGAAAPAKGVGTYWKI